MKKIITLIAIYSLLHSTDLFSQMSALTLKNGSFNYPEKSTALKEFVTNRSDNLTVIHVKLDPSRNQGFNLFDSYQVIGRLAPDVFTILAKSNDIQRLRDDVNAQFIFDLPAYFKISQTLTEKVQDKQKVWISLYDGFNVEDLKALAVDISIENVSQVGNQYFIETTLSGSQIEQIASINLVQFINPAPEPQELNMDKQSLESISAAKAPIAVGGLGLDGTGVTIGVGDNGGYNHIDLSDRVTNCCSRSSTGHSVHVSSTAAGAGLLNPSARGILDKANIVTDDYYDIITNTPTYKAGNNMHVTNNSYALYNSGCSFFGDYDGISEHIDNMLVAHPDVPHVFASGNSGSTSCTGSGTYNNVYSGPQSAKNTIVVANLIKNTLAPAGSSSKGPTDDGRLKPEISAIGNAVYGCLVNNTYGYQGGTSMASPSVAGAIGLMHQANGGPINADLAKAVLVTTADRLDKEGPNFVTGFGKLNVYNACKAIQNGTHYSASVSQGNQNDHIITVPEGTNKLSVSLAWIDPAANPAAFYSLVNDLDLEVIGPDGTILPWVLNPNNATDTAVRMADHLNNVEKVSILAPVAGSYTIRVKGTSVIGSQSFAVAYQMESNEIVVLYPHGGEKLNPGTTIYIQWGIGTSFNSGFNIEYSLDGGGSWTSAGTAGASTRILAWTVPSAFVNNARVRVSAASGSIAQGESNNFIIMGIPQGLTGSSLCPGYAQLNWAAVPSATSYNVYKKSGSSLIFVMNVDTNSAQVGGLSLSNQELLTVTSVDGSGNESEHALSVFVTASAGTCPWANDMAILTIDAPTRGRVFTSSDLGANVPISLTFRNLGTSASSGINAYYKINGGTPVVESLPSVPADSTISFTFSTTANLSSPGSYTIEAGIDGNPDAPNILNNVLTKDVVNLANPPLSLSSNPVLSYFEGFENIPSGSYSNGVFGFDGADRYDFYSNSSQGRCRPIVANGIAKSGNKAMSLDSKSSGTQAANELWLTANLDNYSNTDNVRLDFSYLNHDNTNHTGDKIYLRGSDGDAFFQIYDLYANQAAPGQYKEVKGLNLSQLLSEQGQDFSSSTQIKFGQEGNASIYAAIGAQGISFDDIYLYLVEDDIALTQVLNPTVKECGLSNGEIISVEIKNTVNNSVSGTSIYYKINNGAAVGPFSLGTIAGNATITYNFPAADLSAYGTNSLTVWVSNANDSYNTNDTIKNYLFFNSPLINSFPYLETFETSNGNWVTYGNNTDWAWGTPNKTKIHNAASGSKAWMTKLTSNYSYNQLSFLESPCFDMTTLTNPKISFSIAFEIEAGYDGSWLEISEDGLNWYKLGTFGSGFNWYNNGTYGTWDSNKCNWHVVTQSIPLSLFTDKSKIKFRVVFYSDDVVQMEGIAIDDIHIYESSVIHTSGQTTVSNSITGNNQWQNFSSGTGVLAALRSSENLGIGTVSVYFNPNIPTRHDGQQFFLDRNFTINTTMAPTQPVDVRLYFQDIEVDSCRFAVGAYDRPVDAYELGVTKIHCDNEDGVYGNEVNAVKTYFNYQNTKLVPCENGYYIEFQVNDFSEFYLNSGGVNNDQPLPLTIMSFQAGKQDQHSSWIKYRIKDIVGTDKILLERSFTPDFIQPEVVKSHELSQSNPLNENVIDPVMDGTQHVYYRLKIMDQDGSFAYSNVVVVYFDTPYDAKLNPNPFKDHLELIMTGITEGESFNVDVMDQNGKTVFKQSATVSQGKIRLSSLDQITGGVYFLKVYNESKVKVMKAIKVD